MATPVDRGGESTARERRRECLVKGLFPQPLLHPAAPGHMSSLNNPRNPSFKGERDTRVTKGGAMPNAFAVGQLVEHVFGAKGPYRIVGSMQHRSDGERQYLVTDAVGRVTRVVRESDLREAGARRPTSNVR